MEQGQNRVLIGLPDRLEKAKVAAFALETKLAEAQGLIEATRVILIALPSHYNDDVYIQGLFNMYEIDRSNN